jgi:hypothetical protein
MASITAPSSSKSSWVSPARRPAVWMMSSSSGEPKTGTRIDPNSGSSASCRSARSGIVTRRSSGFCSDLR